MLSDLITSDGRAVVGTAETCQHAAQRIGQIEAGGIGAGVQTAQ